jgi:nicotinate-nucleotide--dimethylbenzimidazole phosphoribosyltransferase
MSNKNIQEIMQFADAIEPPSEVWRQKAHVHLDKLTKPLGSLGRLEDLASQVVAIRRENFTAPLKKSALVFAADHGITAEGVSAYPKEVTYQMVLNFLREGAAINVLSHIHNADLRVVDVGVDADFDSIPGLLNRKVARGTRNMLHEPAMSEEQVAEAISVGMLVAEDAFAVGTNMIAIGEMGIGNTTSASAITCALTGATPESATGRGTGVDPKRHAHKVAVVRTLSHVHFDSSSRPTVFDILRCVGGLEIAAMVGGILAAAHHKLIVVIDGFISTAAAALAVALSPNVQGYLIAGHQSEEPGHKLLLEYLRLTPILSLNMRLGEGTGAILAMPIIESAIALYCRMATFDSAGVSEAS